MYKEKSDLSQNCNFDDDSSKNDCWHCIHFLFPIGCMYWEEQYEQTNSKESSEKSKESN